MDFLKVPQLAGDRRGPLCTNTIAVGKLSFANDLNCDGDDLASRRTDNHSLKEVQICTHCTCIYCQGRQTNILHPDNKSSTLLLRPTWSVP